MPMMNRSLRKYDNQQAGAIETCNRDQDKNDEPASAFGEADRFQTAVVAKLQPVEVDPNDKSMGAFFKRFRWAHSRFICLVAVCCTSNQVCWARMIALTGDAALSGPTPIGLVFP
eukprot:GHUV01024594.1.p3 GENE.GHUV01024594.1~~GHUV01024594.1.p3  ORF type:complete len:115 (-),score=13.88 GHUV01024594.1:397-741(-)